ncbi:MAG: hypothetical protein HFG41_11430 [Coprococcus sp.]|nr:hypothetical protein [Coprococcus sp.]
MAKKKRIARGYTEHFGDDFEVTYTDDLPMISLELEDEDPDIDLYENNIYKNTPYEEYTYHEEDDRESNGRRHMKDAASYSYRSAHSPRNEQNSRKRRQSQQVRQSADARPQNLSHRKQPSGEELAAPLEGPVRASTLMVENLTCFILRPAPAVCAAVITLITIVSFWNGHSAFGEISSLSEGNPILASYLVVGGILLLWELSSFLFALSGLSAGTGRGLTFFIVVYVGSYFASVADHFLPEELLLLEGVKGGLSSFGSLYPMLFPFCVVGFVTCLLRNFMKN